MFRVTFDFEFTSLRILREKTPSNKTQELIKSMNIKLESL